MKRARFEPRGFLALEPRAFGMFFDMPDDPPKNETRADGIALISVRGPLMHHDDSWWCDSYDAIKARVAEAIEANPKAVVLAINSPGGVVDGCFETATEIRSMAAAARVPLYAYVDGQATSAAYALACAGARITVPATGVIGSIGVINALFDATAQDAMFGVKVELIASGARKTDGNPHAPITDGARAAMQRQVMDLAEAFFAHVASARGLSVEAIRSMEAAMMTGAAAVKARLADDVATLDQLLAGIASGAIKQTDHAAAAAGETTMSSKAYEDAIAALRKCAEGDDDQAKKAKRMLAAELAEEDPPAETPAEDEKEEETEATAEAEEDKPEAKAIVARVDALEATQRAQAEATRLALIETERTTLLASRQDLAPELVAVLAKATTSIETVREVVKTHPRGVVRKPAAVAAVVGTRGEGQGGTGSPASSPEVHEMDVAMGLAPRTGGITKQGTAVTFSAMSVEEARKRLEATK